MIKKLIPLGLCLLLIYSLPSSAAKMYRYVAPNGVTVVSRTLPPSISQSGYDILDDKTMRLIRHVDPALTNQQIAAMLAAEKEKETQLAAEKIRLEQEKEDAIFLEAYHSEESLIKDRDHELSKRNKELLTAQEKQSRLRTSLHALQQRAAEQELSGGNIDEQLQSNINIVTHNININQTIIAQLETEKNSRENWYRIKLVRLKELLAAE